jgi:hypothetical protein
LNHKKEDLKIARQGTWCILGHMSDCTKFDAAPIYLWGSWVARLIFFLKEISLAPRQLIDS